MGSLQLPREREESRTTQRFVSGKGLFNQMQQGNLTHTPVLCSETELLRAVEYPSTKRGSSTVTTALRLMLTNALHSKVRELEGPLDSLSHTKA